MSILISLVISSLLFSATTPNICAGIWDNPSTKELEKVLKDSNLVELRNIFTEDPYHNATIVHLLLLQRNLRFKAHISESLYEKQPGIFNLLRVHLHGSLIVEGAIIPSGNYYPSEAQIVWLQNITTKYLQANGITKSSIYDLETFNKLLDRLQNATP